MPDCTYCSESFADEDRYLDHLAAEHQDELGRIDRHRLENAGTIQTTERGSPIIVYGLALAMGLLVIGALGYVLVGGLDSDAGSDNIHDHGHITIAVDGDVLDLDQPAYHDLDPVFHIHPGQGNYWHMHPDRVDLEYAMDALDLPITESSITIDGETYDDTDDGTTVMIAVNDEPVELDYELQDGDHIQITVETDAET